MAINKKFGIVAGRYKCMVVPTPLCDATVSDITTVLSDNRTADGPDLDIAVWGLDEKILSRRRKTVGD